MRTLLQSRILRVLLILVTWTALTGEGSADRSAPRVAFVTETTVYLDAGRTSGIAEGDRFEIERGGRTIAVIEVGFLSSRKAACTPIEIVEWPDPGDAAILVADEAEKAAATEAPLLPAPAAGRSLRDLGFKGRFGLRYFAIDDQSGIGEDYSQPSLTLRTEGNQIAGSPWGFYADVRARRTYRHRSDGSNPESSRNRVYRAVVSWHPPGSAWRSSLGRQVSPDFAAVSLFDGILVKRRAGSWATGLFVGTQPDPMDQGLSSDIFETGGFVKFERHHDEGTRWGVTSGLVGSYEEGELNREYLFLRTLFNNNRTYGTITQEADINRGWKADAGEPGLSSTSTYAFLRQRVFGGTSLEGGFDNRRRVRLYRDRITPETDFDDSYRQGSWIGGTQKFGRDVRVSARVRSRSGGTRSETVNAQALISALAKLRLRARSTRFENKYADGWFHSFSAGLPIGGRTRAEITQGFRQEEEKTEGAETENLHWTSLDIDLSLARRWLLSLSAETHEGDGEDNRSIYMSTSYRF